MNTPAAARSRAGNRATATRWARLLRGLGHRVRIAADDPGHRADVMFALHAWRSAGPIHRFSDNHPDRPLIVVMTGTDIYRFQCSEPEVTRASMDRAHALIGLHDRVADDLPRRFHGRLHTVYQSALPLPSSYPGPRADRFEVCVAGHLRDEKDSLRAAYAVRDLPAESRLRVHQAGKAHTAAAESAANPRYHWFGELAHWRVRRLMARSRLMVMSSRMEGGANVVSEACVAGLPVIASDIPGNRGLLGGDYPGYYPVADTAALQALLLRAEAEPVWLAELARQVSVLAPLFRPETERDGLMRVLQAVTA